MPFGDYLPDQPDHLADGLAAISNALPSSNGYKPVGQFEAITSAMPGVCKGAASFVSPSGLSSIIAGDPTSLYLQLSAGWSSIASGYGIQGDARWRFAQFGGLAIATNATDPMQKIDLTPAGLGTVSALGGSPPKAQMLVVVQNFLVAGVIDGDANTIAWCGENDAEYWAFGSRKSDFNIFADGGAVTGLVGGEYGLVLQRGAVRRMTYVGGNVLFRFDKIASNVGCVTVHSVAQYGDLAFWYSDSGFKMWDGSQIKPIGNQRVDDTFAGLYSVSDWPNMSTAIDGVNTLIMWSMGSKIWCYNWNLDKWSVINMNAEIIFSSFTNSLSIDEQDPSVGALDDDIDGTPLDTLDDPRFQGGAPRLYIFDTAHTMGALTGPNMAASFGMRNTEIVEGRDSRVRSIRPMSDAVSGISVTLDTKQRLGDAATTGTFNSLQAMGEMPVRARGRFVKATTQIAAGTVWSYAQGLDLRLVAGGSR